MKILYVTTVGATMGFFKHYFEDLISHGHKVELASNELEWDYGSDIKKMSLLSRHINCSRSPFKKGNLDAIRQIREMVEEGEYDIVHCHTPIAAFCTRLACRGIRKTRANTDKPLRVIYTAHGFHFYKGAPKLNWILYYTAEKLCARWTDTIVTINNEDYQLAKQKFEGCGRSGEGRGCEIAFVPGVGIDIEKFSHPINRYAKREELGIPEDARVLLSVGELNENKNHALIIRAIAQLKDKNAFGAGKLFYVIAGDGPLKESLAGMIHRYAMDDCIKLLGHRDDCPQLYRMADLFVHPSFREGLPVAVLEALTSGLVCVGSNIRGINDLLPESNMFDPTDAASAAKVIMAPKAVYFDVQQHSYENIADLMNEVYGFKKEITVHDIIRSADF